MLLFVIFTLGTLIGVPWFAYHYDFHTIDWVMFLVLYMVTGLGITIGYHRLLSHRRFECPNWVKACLLIVGRLGASEFCVEVVR
jgi:stearoyl-CoA desaturase (delta-9 desaturase)